MHGERLCIWAGVAVLAEDNAMVSNMSSNEL
eukprot:CAMPEP_0178937470 /NCGR_PEP_ID=MMETSP0786-20121207/25777_2 /TAXON_ID=186022 /ORGANISM="Thalassionema frauenfeldii, Strain CCMP 1798" /LENGTH=30 /DNA_ID= /DNA_START= /DNA_END= /DNA_ORIENTATION=